LSIGRNWSVSTKVLVADDVRVAHYDWWGRVPPPQPHGGQAAGPFRKSLFGEFAAFGVGIPQGSTKLRAAANI
jgi:hypothetical protein